MVLTPWATRNPPPALAQMHLLVIAALLPPPLDPKFPPTQMCVFYMAAPLEPSPPPPDPKFSPPTDMCVLHSCSPRTQPPHPLRPSSLPSPLYTLPFPPPAPPQMHRANMAAPGLSIPVRNCVNNLTDQLAEMANSIITTLPFAYLSHVK